MYSNKHSSYSSSFPIYLFTQKEQEIPDEDAEAEPEAEEEEKSSESEETESDDDEAVVEEVPEDEEKKDVAPKTKKIIVDEWEQLNAQPPVWTRSVESLFVGRLCLPF